MSIMDHDKNQKNIVVKIEPIHHQIKIEKIDNNDNSCSNFLSKNFHNNNNNNHDEVEKKFLPIKCEKNCFDKVEKWCDKISQVSDDDFNINSAIMREISLFKIKYPFLTDKQIQGKALDKFGIPSLLGDIVRQGPQKVIGKLSQELHLNPSRRPRVPKSFKMSNKIFHDSQKKPKKIPDSPLVSSSPLSRLFSFNNKENTSKLSKLFSFNNKENIPSPKLSQKFPYTTANKENTWGQKLYQLFSSTDTENINSKKKPLAVQTKENNSSIVNQAKASKINSPPVYYPPRKRYFSRSPKIDDVTDDEDDEEPITPSKKPRKFKPIISDDLSDDEYFSIYLKRREKKEKQKTIINEEKSEEPPIESESLTPRSRRTWVPTRLQDLPDDVRKAICLDPSQRRKEIAQRLAAERASRPMMKFSDLLDDDKSHDLRDDKSHDLRDDKNDDLLDDKNDDLLDDKNDDLLDDKSHDLHDNEEDDLLDDKNDDLLDDKNDDLLDEFNLSPVEQQLLDMGIPLKQQSLDMDTEISAYVLTKSPFSTLSEDNHLEQNDCRVVYEKLKSKINPFYEGNWQPSQQSSVNSWRNEASQDFSGKSREIRWSQDTLGSVSQEAGKIRRVINEPVVDVDEDSDDSSMSQALTKLNFKMDEQGLFTCCFMCDRDKYRFRLNSSGSEARQFTFDFDKPFDKSVVSRIIVSLGDE